MPKAVTAQDLCKERDIQRCCEDLLMFDDWSIFRLEQQWSEKKQKLTGEKGAPDALCVRYLAGDRIEFLGTDRYRAAVLKSPAAEVLLIEWKRNGGRVSKAQKAWHAAERARGALVLVAGQDFSPTIEGFMEWYRASGLMRKELRW